MVLPFSCGWLGTDPLPRQNWIFCQTPSRVAFRWVNATDQGLQIVLRYTIFLMVLLLNLWHLWVILKALHEGENNWWILQKEKITSNSNLSYRLWEIFLRVFKDFQRILCCCCYIWNWADCRLIWLLSKSNCGTEEMFIENLFRCTFAQNKQLQMYSKVKQVPKYRCSLTYFLIKTSGNAMEIKSQVPYLSGGRRL